MPKTWNLEWERFSKTDNFFIEHVESVMPATCGNTPTSLEFFPTLLSKFSSGFVNPFLVFDVVKFQHGLGLCRKRSQNVICGWFCYNH
jgi:hypothetical protein